MDIFTANVQHSLIENENANHRKRGKRNKKGTEYNTQELSPKIKEEEIKRQIFSFFL